MGERAGAVLGQRAHVVRLDWGATGAEACAGEDDVVVVVDVLSFSTSVTVAVERGTRVYPSPWGGVRAGELAERVGAVLAVGRLEAVRAGAAGMPTLSPARLREVDAPARLVLPSPNGSAIADAAARRGAVVVAGCLRNAGAVATWAGRALERGHAVVVVAAGERWVQDGSLRPALEDHLGAGAVLSRLRALGHGGAFGAEARAAAGLFDAVAGGAGDQRALAGLLRDCAGGREPAGAGFGADVDVAAELDASVVVPVLVDGAFVAA